MMKQEFLKKYAELVVGLGANIQKGALLQIGTTVDDYELAKFIATEAYNRGAKIVKINIDDQDLVKARLNNQNEDEISYIPAHDKLAQYVMTSEKWHTIRIANTSQDGATKSVDPKKLNLASKIASENDKLFREARMSNKTPWVVIASPNTAWANKIYENNDKGNLEKLIVELKSILRLDSDNPVQEWRKHNENLKNRADTINNFKFKYLHFENERTDLKVYLNPTSSFEGGSATTDYGLEFFANLPTEEIFTSPNWRKTSGKVAVCKPVQIYGNSVRDIEFEFKDGKVVNFNASEGKDLLEKFLDTDQGARYLGEVALVDTNSPIYRSGLLFSNILFDENASSHIAIGRGYPFTLRGASNIKSDEELKEYGCNISNVHTDFMIGTSTTNVSGYTEDGTKITIMSNGLFAI